uniref:Tim44-like domain-containing protein n=1 Tax=Callithrix jacchus TaxID=9483 RepID=A0A8I3WTF0_CALJA
MSWGRKGPTEGPSDSGRGQSLQEGSSRKRKCLNQTREALGVVLHKDSRWYQQWKDFKENNLMFNRFFEMKMKFDESDNALIQASMALMDKVTDLLGGLFSKTEMSEVLMEILRVDLAFVKDQFLKQYENDIIPSVLEAMISGELTFWCYEATYSQLAHPIQQAKALGLQFHSRILDIDKVDLAMGKMMRSEACTTAPSFLTHLMTVGSIVIPSFICHTSDLINLEVYKLCRSTQESNLVFFSQLYPCLLLPLLFPSFCLFCAYFAFFPPSF